MPRKTLLTSRAALFSIPQRQVALLRFDTLSEEDLQNIGARRLFETYGWGMQAMPSQIDIEPTY